MRVQLDRLKEHFTDEEVEQIEADHKALKKRYRDNSAFKSKMNDMQDQNMTSFNDAWKEAPNYASLNEFAGLFAVAFPSTATVEADFSGIQNVKETGGRVRPISVCRVTCTASNSMKF